MPSVSNSVEDDSRVHGRAPRTRVATVALASLFLFGLIVSAFWYWDVRYSRPTPRPAALVQAPLGTYLPVDVWLASAGLDAGGRPVHLHFFNPTCPCSRFNVDHLHQLVRKFGGRVYFAAVVESELAESSEGHRELMSIATDLGIPWIADSGGRIAAATGVYSTPQAVVIAADGSLFYRGNYNTSRYCTDPRTEFARLALQALLDTRKPVGSSPELPAYGCELPSKLAAGP